MAIQGKLGFFISDSNPLLLKLRALSNELSLLTKKYTLGFIMFGPFLSVWCKIALSSRRMQGVVWKRVILAFCSTLDYSALLQKISKKISKNWPKIKINHFSSPLLGRMCVTPMMMPRPCPSGSRLLKSFFKSHNFLIMKKWLVSEEF